ncbi:MAG: TetR/AcrR family transcriptional regulator [Lachnospiraceae bacterium]|nr:TetR/AcrR family transcriptional regulator [Lachnospiraceae bacterium]
MPKVSEEYFRIKRKEIVDAAYRVCIRKSISAVELKDVIAETGMSHGAIYRYFKDLDEIIGAMLIQVNSEDPYIEDVERIFDDTDGRLPIQIIGELCQFLYQQMDGCGIDAVKISFYANVFMINEPERAAKIFESIKDCNTSSSSYLICKFAEYVEQQTIKGNLHPKCSLDDLVQYLVASYDGILMTYLLKEPTLEREGEKAACQNGKLWLKNLFLALEYTIINLLGCEEEESEKDSENNG